jgi:dTDP-3-amino-2,3,6-trideoxy-4-keto-D-glucose/dTDP-3-amino-3,4,6-trideoxy-alpha-D-glucose/dTDP-2,6-dideoxy-D-kanosamine transaminase
MNSPVPFFRFSSEAALQEQITEGITRVANSSKVILGPEVAAFEAAFARYVGVAECVSLANGSDALELALKAVGVTRASKVAAVANAGFYSSTAIHAVGATPIYVDIETDTMTMSPDAFAQACAIGLDAVIVTHLYGQMAKVEQIIAVAQQHGVKVIEDCAQSHGARSVSGAQAMTGSFADVSCFSFYPTKNLGAMGDGGAVCTNDKALAERVRSLRQYGWSTKYHVTLPQGRNSRLDEMQAVILSAKLNYLDQWNEQRRHIAQRYVDAFRSLAHLRLPCSIGQDYVAHLFVLRTDARDDLKKHLTQASIGTDVHYPIADHHQTAYPVVPQFSLVESEKACNSVLTLPCFPGMQAAEVDRVIDAVKSWRRS